LEKSVKAVPTIAMYGYFYDFNATPANTSRLDGWEQSF
jgi:hypothetical protein